MVFATYDLQTDHLRLKNRVKALGWKDTIVASNGNLINLPNTSLWKDGNDTSAAREEIKSVLSRPNLERLMVVVSDSWAAIVGEPF